MNLAKYVVVFTFVSALFSPWIRAEDTPSTNQSVSFGSSLYSALQEKALLTYLGIYRGGPLSAPGNSLQPLPDGTLDSTSPQSIENLVHVGYKFNKDLMVGVLGHFFYYPVGNPAGQGQDLQLYDPALMIAKNNLIDFNGLRLTGRLYVFLPFTAVDRLQTNQLATAISPTVIVNYRRVSHSKCS